MRRNTTLFTFNIPCLPQYRKAWLVGGAVRDILMGEEPLDLDIVVSQNAAEYARQLADKLNVRAVELGQAPLNVHRIASKNRTFDIVDLNGCSIKEDLLKRDFSINAMAWDLADDGLIDFTNGCKDLERKKIRMVSPSVFQNDPLRLLRAFRLSAVFGFQIEKTTLAAITKEAHLIKATPWERIRAEWHKILASADSSATISAMDQANLLESILPEVTRLKKHRIGLKENTDMFTSTLAALSSLETFLKVPALFLGTGSDCSQQETICKTPELLKFALLLHDIGRPELKISALNSQTPHLAHGKESARMAGKIMRRMTYSNSQRRYTTLMIEHHYFPITMFYEHQHRTFQKQAAVRLFQKTKEATPDLLLHSLAAFSGLKKSTGGLKEASDFKDFTLRLLAYYHHHFKPIRQRAPLATGRDLITYFKLSPSPLFKTILDLVEEKRLTGQLKSKREAHKYIKSFLNENGKQHGS